eukprot:Awhi_evm1s1590
MSEAVQRSAILHHFATELKKLSHEYQVAVVLINQVSDQFNDSMSNYNQLNFGLKESMGKVAPALGLSWSNFVNVRIGLKKEQKYFEDVIGNNRATRDDSDNNDDRNDLDNNNNNNNNERVMEPL